MLIKRISMPLPLPFTPFSMPKLWRVFFLNVRRECRKWSNERVVRMNAPSKFRYGMAAGSFLILKVIGLKLAGFEKDDKGGTTIPHVPRRRTHWNIPVQLRYSSIMQEQHNQIYHWHSCSPRSSIGDCVGGKTFVFRSLCEEMGIIFPGVFLHLDSLIVWSERDAIIAFDFF